MRIHIFFSNFPDRTKDPYIKRREQRNGRLSSKRLSSAAKKAAEQKEQLKKFYTNLQDWI